MSTLCRELAGKGGDLKSLNIMKNWRIMNRLKYQNKKFEENFTRSD